MTEQQEWLEIQCEDFELCSEQIVRFGIFYVNKDGDILVTEGDGKDRFKYYLQPYYSAEIEIRAKDNDYKVVKDMFIKENKNMTWWIKRYAKSFSMAFCLAWKRAGLNPSDRFFQKDLVTLDPEQHVDEVILLQINIPHTRKWQFDPVEYMSGFDYMGFSKLERTYKTENRMIMGNYDPKQTRGKSRSTGQPICDIIPYKYIVDLKGYKMATKMINIEDFMNEFGWIGWDDQRRPYELLADLELYVLENWQKSEKVASNYVLDYLGGRSVEFQFSHFEINNDLFDETYSCVFACYKYVGTVK